MATRKYVLMFWTSLVLIGCNYTGSAGRALLVCDELEAGLPRRPAVDLYAELSNGPDRLEMIQTVIGQWGRRSPELDDAIIALILAGRQDAAWAIDMSYATIVQARLRARPELIGGVFKSVRRGWIKANSRLTWSHMRRCSDIAFETSNVDAENAQEMDDRANRWFAQEYLSTVLVPRYRFSDRFVALLIVASMLGKAELVTECNLAMSEQHWASLIREINNDLRYLYFDENDDCYLLDYAAKQRGEPVDPERQFWSCSHQGTR